MKQEKTANNMQGEVLGAFLNGIVSAFRKINILSTQEAEGIVNNINSNVWYPIVNFFQLFEHITRGNDSLTPLLYKAGMFFSDDWYNNGPGKDLISGGIDYLKLQDNSAGYHSVVRGKKNDIGFINIESLNEEDGLAVIDARTPFPKEYEMGVFYGGMMAPGDMEWVRIETDEKNCRKKLFNRKITIRFKARPSSEIENELHNALGNLESGKESRLSPGAVKALLWRYRALEEAFQRDSRFWNLSNDLLEKASEKLFYLTQKLGTLANIDTLTGLFNRRKILEIGELELRRIKRTQSPISFIMVDIDHFKNINDTYGHQCGDVVLQEISSCIKKSIRETDYIARIGGEEFLLILPDTSPDNAVRVAEKLRDKIERLKINYKNQSISATISLGVNCYLCEKSFEKLCSQADIALYYSKHHGRNRVTIYSEEIDELNH